MSAAAAARTRRLQVEADKEIFEAELHSLVCFLYLFVVLC